MFFPGSLLTKLNLIIINCIIKGILDEQSVTNSSKCNDLVQQNFFVDIPEIFHPEGNATAFKKQWKLGACLSTGDLGFLFAAETCRENWRKVDFPL